MGEKDIGGLDVSMQYRLGTLPMQVFNGENQLQKPHPTVHTHEYLQRCAEGNQSVIAS